MDYEIRGNYPNYTIWQDGVEDTRFACNTLEQAQALILDLRGAAFAKDFEPWRIRNSELYISNRGMAHNVHTQVYQLGAITMNYIKELERIAAALKEEAAQTDRERENFEFAAKMVNAAKTTLKSIEFRQAAALRKINTQGMK